MSKIISLGLCILGFACALFGSDLQNVIDGLPERGDGAFLRKYPNGFRIYGVGTAAVDDPDDANAVLRAEKIASMNARKALSEYISQTISASEKAESEFRSAEATSEVEGEGAAKISETFSEEHFKEEMSMGTQSLMKGVVTLKTITVQKGQHLFTKVLVGYSSRTLETLEAAGNASVSQTAPMPAESTAAVGAPQPPPPAEQKEEWIVCIGHGSDRKLAIQAAIIEGIQQVYGTYLENSDTYKSRFEKIKANGMTAQTEETETTQDTLTQTKGFVDAYRIISVEPVAAGMEAKIQAKFVNPRAGGLKALMVYPMEIPPSKETNQYTVAYKTTMSGAGIGQTCSRYFEKALARINKYLILNIDDMASALGQQKLTQELVGSGNASPAELSKIGRLLTADFIVKTSFGNIQYTRKIGMDKTTKKLAPSERLVLSIDYKLVEVKTGETRKKDTIEVVLNNDCIAAIRAGDEEMTEQEASNTILNAAFEALATKLAEDAQL